GGGGDKTADFEKELNTLKASLAEKEQALQAKTEALTQAQAALEAQKTTAAQAEEAQENAKELTAELTTSKEELTALQARVKELEAEISRLKEQLSRQQNARQAVQETVPTQAPVTAVAQQAPIQEEKSEDSAVTAETAEDTVQEEQIAPVTQEEQDDDEGLDNDHDGNVDATIVLSGVNFTVGTAELTRQAAASLRTTAKLLKKHAPNQRFEVAGYTDSMGSSRINQRLSQQRAQAVRTFLIEQGIARELLVSKGYGERNPIADNNTSAGRAMNRRVELHQITAE
ncbi:MAG: hypothetical protein D3904_04575, partial [Candidatus Electrothrix sp. EH2]|nr:hypothetical protein [Candidatus Electrothrix sp. EH2]